MLHERDFALAFKAKVTAVAAVAALMRGVDPSAGISAPVDWCLDAEGEPVGEPEEEPNGSRYLLGL